MYNFILTFCQIVLDHILKIYLKMLFCALKIIIINYYYYYYYLCTWRRRDHKALWSKNAFYRVFSLTWPASMQIYWNKRKRLHKKRVQLPQDWFGTPTWPPFHCFRLHFSFIFIFRALKPCDKDSPISVGKPVYLFRASCTMNGGWWARVLGRRFNSRFIRLFERKTHLSGEKNAEEYLFQLSSLFRNLCETEINWKNCKDWPRGLVSLFIYSPFPNFKDCECG